MVVLEKSSDGRWWISKFGWGRPVGDFAKALEAAEQYYPQDKITIQGEE